MKFSEAIKEFNLWRGLKVSEITRDTQDYGLRQFCLYLHDRDIEDIKLGDITDYLTLCRKFPTRDISLKSKVDPLKAIFKYFYLKDQVKLRPELIPTTHYEKKLPRVISEEEYNKMLSYVFPMKPLHFRNQAIIRILWDCGMRVGELVSLNIPEMNLRLRKAKIHTEKKRWSWAWREVFWSKETGEAIKEWLWEREQVSLGRPFRDSTALFVSLENCNWGHRLEKQSVQKMVRYYSEKLGIYPPLYPHSFRHAFCRRIIMQGGTNADIMNLAGHSDIASTTIYSKMWGNQAESRYRHIFRA